MPTPACATARQATDSAPERGTIDARPFHGPSMVLPWPFLAVGPDRPTSWFVYRRSSTQKQSGAVVTQPRRQRLGRHCGCGRQRGLAMSASRKETWAGSVAGFIFAGHLSLKHHKLLQGELKPLLPAQPPPRKQHRSAPNRLTSPTSHIPSCRARQRNGGQEQPHSPQAAAGEPQPAKGRRWTSFQRQSGPAKAGAGGQSVSAADLGSVAYSLSISWGSAGLTCGLLVWKTAMPPRKSVFTLRRTQRPRRTE